MANFSELDRYLFGQATHYEIYRKLGAHFTDQYGIRGVCFDVWAPNAARIWVIGSFNGWDETADEMTRLEPDTMGIFELFIPGIEEGALYKYLIETKDGKRFYKADPYANYAELRPGTASAVTDIEHFKWTDEKWMEERAKTKDIYAKPMAIYEVHPGSWMRHPGREDDGFYSYRDLVKYLIPYVKEMGYTHIELMGISEYPFDENLSAEVNDTFTVRDVIIILLVFGGLALYVYGCIKFAWGYDYMAAIMLITCVAAGFVGKMNANDIAKNFISGVKKMVYAGFLIGLASAISVIITDGQIIHTIIYYISMPLVLLPKTLAAVFMFLVNLVFNFFVSSASGQAAIVMPLMVPMADILEIPRQVAVLAYQYGDGFSNCIIPTSGVLMAALGVARVPFEKWLKFMMPLFLIWTLVGCFAVATGVLINLQ